MFNKGFPKRKGRVEEMHGRKGTLFMDALSSSSVPCQNNSHCLTTCWVEFPCTGQLSIQAHLIRTWGRLRCQVGCKPTVGANEGYYPFPRMLDVCSGLASSAKTSEGHLPEPTSLSLELYNSVWKAKALNIYK